MDNQTSGLRNGEISKEPVKGVPERIERGSRETFIIFQRTNKHSLGLGLANGSEVLSVCMRFQFEKVLNLCSSR